MRWDNLKKPLDDGGLGITDIKQQNKALLAKWVQRFNSEKEALWRILIKAKDGSCHFDLKASEMRNPASKSTWKHIIKQKDLIYENIQCIVGNGEATAFWNDFQIGDGPLNQKYPRLHHLARDKDASAAEVFSLKYNYNGADFISS